MIELDGRTGEGGGQLVRIAVALAAVTGQAVRIDNVRGNRQSGGLKAQHVSAVAWLADVTGAAVEGVRLGSSTLVFRPGKRGTDAAAAAAGSKGVDIVLWASTTAASTSLMLQAVLPYVLFSAPAPAPASSISLVLHGGTHVSWAPSFDYLDQVLFPALETWFGVRVDRTLEARGWSTGPAERSAGCVRLAVTSVGDTGLTPRMPALGGRRTEDIEDALRLIDAVDATILAPLDMQPLLTEALARALEGSRLAEAGLHLRTVEDSGHDARVYVLLVARTATGQDRDVPVRRWGRDYLGTENVRKRAGQRGRGGRGGRGGKSGKSGKSGSSDAETGIPGVCDRIARRLVNELVDEVDSGGCGDVFLQDQVVVFQALAAGRTAYWREEVAGALERLRLDDTSEDEAEQNKEEKRPDRTRKPFGQGSLHAQTARWVTAQMLAVRWFRDGTECEGARWKGEAGERM